MCVQNKRGFTLIELLIVVVIIGILAAIAIPKFAATKDKAKLASVRTDLRNVMTAQEAYYIDNSLYTNSLSSTTFNPSQGNAVGMIGTSVSFTATVSNASITTGLDTCRVTVGSGSTNDGEIVCSVG